MSTAYGYCHCGCGAKTTISRQNHKKFGWVRGKPKKFVHGHARRKSIPYKIKDCGYLTPCWLTQRRLIMRDGSSTLTHKYLWEKRHGAVPPGKELDHLCKQGTYGHDWFCVRPSHLEPVTRAVNVQRGRNAKLTVDAVVRIRYLRARKGTSVKELSALFGISPSQVKKIIYRRRWVDF